MEDFLGSLEIDLRGMKLVRKAGLELFGLLSLDKLLIELIRENRLNGQKSELPTHYTRALFDFVRINPVRAPLYLAIMFAIFKIHSSLIQFFLEQINC